MLIILVCTCQRLRGAIHPLRSVSNSLLTLQLNRVLTAKILPKLPNQLLLPSLSKPPPSLVILKVAFLLGNTHKLTRSLSHTHKSHTNTHTHIWVNSSQPTVSHISTCTAEPKVKAKEKGEQADDDDDEDGDRSIESLSTKKSEKPESKKDSKKVDSVCVSLHVCVCVRESVCACVCLFLCILLRKS